MIFMGKFRKTTRFHVEGKFLIAAVTFLENFKIVNWKPLICRMSYLIFAEMIVIFITEPRSLPG